MTNKQQKYHVSAQGGTTFSLAPTTNTCRAVKIYHLNTLFSTLGLIRAQKLFADLHITRQGDVDTCWIYPVIVEAEKADDFTDVNVDTTSVEDAIAGAVSGKHKIIKYFEPINCLRTTAITAIATEQSYIERRLNIAKQFNKAIQLENKLEDDAHEFFLALVVFSETMASAVDVAATVQYNLEYFKVNSEMF